MPRKRKPARLYLHPKERIYIIRDGKTYQRTGYGEGQIELAEKELAAYTAGKWKPETKISSSSSLPCSTALMVYVEHKIDNIKDPADLITTVARLNEFWGNKKVDEIIGHNCREYAKLGSQSTARRDLAYLSAAINLYAKEYSLDVIPQVSLPPKEAPRENYLTRSQAAQLLKQAYRSGNRHLVRFILIGLYSASRSGVILDLQWHPNTVGGYVDLDKCVIHREAPRKLKTNKRKPPVVITNRLLFWLKRWKAQDTANDATTRHIVMFRGKPLKSIKKAWNASRDASNTPKWAVPHILRHTSVTWAMQSGRNIHLVSQYAGMTIDVLERTYWHHHPDFQSDMKDMF